VEAGRKDRPRRPAGPPAERAAQAEDREVAAPVAPLPLDHVPGHVEQARLRREGEVVGPRQGDGQDPDRMPRCKEGAGEAWVGVVLGQEPRGMGGLDQKEDGGVEPRGGEGGELLHVPPSARRDRVGEHGDAPAEEGARLHLEEDPAAPPREQEVEAASP